MGTKTETGPANRSYREVLRNRRVAALLTGDLLSYMGTGMIIVAMPVQTLDIHGSVPPAIAISVVETSPFVLSTALALGMGLGRLRVPPRVLLLADCLLRFAVFITLAVLSANGDLTLPVLVAGLLFGSVFRLVGSSARRLLATSMVGEEDLFAVNGLLGVNSNFALYVVGPAVGGLAVVAWGPGTVLLFDAIGSLLLFAVVLLWVPSQPPEEQQTKENKNTETGWRILRRRPQTARLFAVVFFFNFFYMPVEIALPLLVQGPLNSNGAGLGVLWGAFGAGALLGAVVTNYARKLPEHILLITIIALWALCPLALAISGNLVAAVLVFALGGLVWAPFTPVVYSFVQSALRPDEQQPVVTLWVAGSTLAAPLGLAAGGPLIEYVGTRGGLALSGLLTLLLVPLAGVGLLTSKSKGAPGA
ncbi:MULTISPECIES: MFS transporter [Streptomyces]|uniref:MFS transporter n=1 Tax=Streptomyces TaxID=1883 RepID=UPI001B32870D|nr:MFS transporter [Streptomyces sp. AgN23]QTI90607.1 MFS transporter [Streptomyces sp. AgN23]WTA78568.1 MFS transporter [Streptomyces antimycoticus]WTA86832.1 MFS transporter [Streptomyces antimycoticus]